MCVICTGLLPCLKSRWMIGVENMNKHKNIEIKVIFATICVLFGLFLMFPMVMILGKSFFGNSGFTLEFYQNMFQGKNFGRIFGNSVAIAMLSAAITTVLAFVLAYSIHFTNLPPVIKKIIRIQLLIKRIK